MESTEFLERLSNGFGPSGYEYSLKDSIADVMGKYADELKVDNLGNIIAIKRGNKKESKIKIMVAAHMDEIGLMVTAIEDNGFLRFTQIGGIDQRTLLGQEVIVHGEKDLFGVIGVKPPHLQTRDELDKAVKMEDMAIDIGYSKEEVEKIVKIGDVITIRRKLTHLLNEKYTGKALDDRTGIIALYECIKELKKLNHEADAYLVSTVQEEVGTRGAYTSTYGINPDIGIAVDVGFASSPEIPKEYTLDIGKGPGITIGGNIHPGLRKKLVEIAKEYNIPYQFEVEPGPTGTDARAIQISREGIPALCISLPLKYMHTSVEVIDMNDIKNTGKLLALFIASISKENLEGLLCY
ncbi:MULTISPECIES: M42 family metallopeptidase [Tissierellales]|uniref:M42 family peptidase n=1 Tax=Acidilutibacter cellobiosedens TaxID=2507161 RepID=A0A410QCC1_9FIRM|nr:MULTISPECIES: M42 family metallopeptidase [Tissierellales]QAT61712.1 M42 family peptidase [Acidilutibacter cellobiosedens]SCL82607.1 putative aminopeptidase YsdC [Sporanaerobacter sp. PP17-6a]